MKKHVFLVLSLLACISLWSTAESVMATAISDQTVLLSQTSSGPAKAACQTACGEKDRTDCRCKGCRGCDCGCGEGRPCTCGQACRCACGCGEGRACTCGQACRCDCGCAEGRPCTCGKACRCACGCGEGRACTCGKGCASDRGRGEGCRCGDRRGCDSHSWGHRDGDDRGRDCGVGSKRSFVGARGCDCRDCCCAICRSCGSKDGRGCRCRDGRGCDAGHRCGGDRSCSDRHAGGRCGDNRGASCRCGSWYREGAACQSRCGDGGKTPKSEKDQRCQGKAARGSAKSGAYGGDGAVRDRMPRRDQAEPCGKGSPVGVGKKAGSDIGQGTRCRGDV